jgi:hypothetical protein
MVVFDDKDDGRKNSLELLDKMTSDGEFQGLYTSGFVPPTKKCQASEWFNPT